MDGCVWRAIPALTPNAQKVFFLTCNPEGVIYMAYQQRSQRWEMVSQLLSAAAEAELRHLRDERRGQSPSSLLRASAPAILRTSASGKASCSSGSAPFRCWMSEHRGPAAITAARSQRGAPHCLLRAATRFYMRHSAQLQANPTASKAPERLCAAEEE